MEADQTGLPPWAAALTAQPQMAVADQLAAQDKAHRAELQELVEECQASARDAVALLKGRSINPEQPGRP